MKKYDLTVYGATGFTGKQAAHALIEACAHYGLTLALAGRNKGKLEAVARELPPHTLKQAVGILVAESTDQKALDQLTEHTKVVVNLAGPFAKYAPLLIASCVKNNCDYVDITGEAVFISEMVACHHEKARQNGVRIVPFCGFDSVPSDLGWYFVLREWRRRFQSSKEACQHIVSLLQMKGGFNGGTALTALQMAREGTMQTLAQGLTILCDPNAPQPPVAPDWKSPRLLKKIKGYGAPFFMAPINTRVVRRSQTLFALEEGLKTFSPANDFCYEEGLLIPEPLPVLSGLVSLVLLSLDTLSRSSLFLSLGEKLVPKPGEGPSEKTMDSGFIKVTYVATGSQGSTLKARFESQGDPGNRTTIKILTQAALCLALEEERKELPQVSGVLTPAYAFRDVLLKRLSNNGMPFQVLPNY